MSSHLALLIGADNARLYHKLRAAGICLQGMRPRLTDNAIAQRRISFRLIACAMEQTAPAIARVRRGKQYLEYHLDTPALWQRFSYDSEGYRRIRQCLAGYDAPPVFVSVGRAGISPTMVVTIHFCDVSESWFCQHSLSAFWDAITAVCAEIRRQDADLQAQTATHS